MKKNIIYAIIAALFVMLTIAGCSGLTGGDNGTDPNRGDDSSGSKTCTETYTDQVPYDDTEFYTEKVCIGRQFCEQVEYTDFTVKTDALGKVCNIQISNTGNVTGEWKVVAKFITTNSGGGPISEPLTKTVAPGKTEKFEFQYAGSDTPSTCYKENRESTVPTTESCKCGGGYTNQRKSRTVIKYREEEKTREVSC